MGTTVKRKEKCTKMSVKLPSRTILRTYNSRWYDFSTKFNRSIGLSVPHTKHITSPLRAQQVNAPIVLWRWCSNLTITILYIIRRPVYYLKLNSTLYVCPYLTGNTLRLRYEPNQLILSIGLWRWLIYPHLECMYIEVRPHMCGDWRCGNVSSH
jgi:hypothetical protein